MRALVLVAVACSAQSAQPDASAEAGTRAIVVDHVDDLGAFPAPPTRWRISAGPADWRASF